jgi:hypothetical protein
MVATQARLDEWTAWVFAREDSDGAWDDDAEWIVLPEPVLLGYLTEVFERAGDALAAFGDDQLAEGFRFLVSSERGAQLRPCLDRELPVEERARAVRASAAVFREVFARRCSPVLSHLDEEQSELELACYMWWDESPFHADLEPELVAACFDAMEETLALAHDACREAALHGLGHFQTTGPLEERRRAIVERFLAAHPELRPELREYAEAALTGAVL